MLVERARHVLARLEEYVRSENYAGWDPYDALNSRLLRGLTACHPLAQRVAIHLLKSSPWNVRALLGITKMHNPTALSLFTDTYINLYRIEGREEYLVRAHHLWHLLRRTSCIDTRHELAWGRNFPFVTAQETHELGKPLTFLNAKIGCTLLTLYRLSRTPDLMDCAERIATATVRHGKVFHVQGLSFLGYSSSPRPRFIVNACMLAAQFFLHFLRSAGQQDYTVDGTSVRTLAQDLLATVLRTQAPDGSWPYGYSFTLKRLGRIDFHQGFVLDSLLETARLLDDPDTRRKALLAYDRGLAFMTRVQITPHGAFCWKPSRTYPIDIHNQAQGIISLSKAPHNCYDERLEAILRFTLDNFWDEMRGYFYYQKHMVGLNRIPYMRWAQGWMAYALSEYIRRYR